MMYTRQQLKNMPYPDLCRYWATKYVDRLTLIELRQVTIGNMSLISSFPRLQQARQVWRELKLRQATPDETPKLIL